MRALTLTARLTRACRRLAPPAGLLLVALSCGDGGPTTPRNPQPSISSVDPGSREVDGGAFDLLVTGSGFMRRSVVRWNGIDRPTAYLSRTQLRAAIDAQALAVAGAARVSVINPRPGGGESAPASLAIYNPAPAVTGLTPSTALAGGGRFTLSVAGARFMRASRIQWKGAERATTYVSATELRTELDAPDIADAGAFPVSVTTPTPGGGSATDTLHIDNPVPSIAKTSPNQLEAETGPLTLTISGAGFVAASVGQWNGSRRPTTLTSGTELRMTLSAQDLMTEGSATVSVSNPTPGGGTATAPPLPVSTAAVVSVQVQAPSTQVQAGQTLQATATPRSRSGRDISALKPACVTWGTSDTAVATVSAAGVVTAVLGGSVTVTATCDGVSGTLTLGVTNPTPALTTLQPLFVDVGQAFVLIVSGSKFVRSSVVSWNGVAKPTTFVSPTELRAQIDASDASAEGVARVVVATPAPAGGTTLVGSLRVGAPGQAVARGVSHSCALQSTGQAYCWGEGRGGELGTGTSTSSPIATPVSGPVFKSIVASFGYTCGLTAAGLVYCWGGNVPGRIYAPKPTPVNLPESVREIAAGDSHACAIGASLQAYCWGENEQGELGNGTTGIRSASPVLVQTGVKFARIAVGSRHSCALSLTGRAYCWGGNNIGELGDGTYRSSPVPRPVASATPFTELALGSFHTCALSVTGQPYCWGNNQYGQLGIGRYSVSEFPTATAVGSFSSLTAGPYYTCGLAGETPYCWGANDFGMLGNGKPFVSSSAPQVVTGVTLWAMAAGWGGACGLSRSGRAYCWGDGEWGQLGNGSLAFRNSPAHVVSNEPFTQVSVGTTHTCALTTSGDTRCWGSNFWTQLGATSSGVFSATPVPALVPESSVQLSLNRDVSCSLGTSRRVYCWGMLSVDNDGSPVGTMGSLPTIETDTLSFTTLASGPSHRCGLTSAHRAYCWGHNASGQLGDGTTTDRATPVEVLGGHELVSIAASYTHTCALDSSGAAYCWGSRSQGILGMDPASSSAVPVPVQGGGTYRAISVGPAHTCAIDTTGKAFCWGDGRYGALGTDSRWSTTPEEVQGGQQFTAIATGDSFTCALATSAQLYCWGNNDYGQLGTGRTSDQVPGGAGNPVPEVVLGGVTFKSLSAGTVRACGVSTAAQIYCWGENLYGALGDGSTGFASTPVAVAGALGFQPGSRGVLSCLGASCGSSDFRGRPASRLRHGPTNTEAHRESLAATACSNRSLRGRTCDHEKSREGHLPQTSPAPPR